MEYKLKTVKIIKPISEYCRLYITEYKGQFFVENYLC